MSWFDGSEGFSHLIAHPFGGVPHAETLGVPAWVQWLLIAIIVGTLGWLLLDIAPAQRRPTRAPHPADEDLAEIDQPLVIRAGSTAPVSNAVELDRAEERRAQAPVVEDVARPERRVALNPLRVLVTVLGITMGLAAIDQVRSVEAIAQFMRTDTSARIAWLAWLWVILVCVGGAVVCFSPRTAAAVFLAAGGLGTFLAQPDAWETRLEWWDASYLLSPWNDLAWWTAGAYALAIAAWLSSYYRSGRRKRVNG